MRGDGKREREYKGETVDGEKQVGEGISEEKKIIYIYVSIELVEEIRG